MWNKVIKRRWKFWKVWTSLLRSSLWGDRSLTLVTWPDKCSFCLGDHWPFTVEYSYFYIASRVSIKQEVLVRFFSSRSSLCCLSGHCDPCCSRYETPRTSRPGSLWSCESCLGCNGNSHRFRLESSDRDTEEPRLLGSRHSRWGEDCSG